MIKFSTVVVGGGASGMAAAISARLKGATVAICEKMPKIGKKVLVSGNGRCNLSNEDLNESHYNKTARPLVRSVLERFPPAKINGFFEDLGLRICSEDGRLFPVTNQAASVLKVLEMELARLSVSIEPGFEVTEITPSDDGFSIVSKSGREIRCGSVVMACGGNSYPALGSDGASYKLAARFGHKIVQPVPAAVPLIAKDPLCHVLQGQKIQAAAKSVIGGKTVREASGDVLFTKYGLSGAAILDISDDISIAHNRHKIKDVCVHVDMVPFMQEDRLQKEIRKRIEKGLSAEDLISGILPNKFGPALKSLLSTKSAEAIASGLKKKRFDITGTRGWNEADFTAGGVDAKEVNELTLESLLKKGLYFSGEILDVNGERGGYNLAWAWASGHVAGESASAS